MSTATGEFSIAALSSSDIQLGASSSKPRQSRQTLTAETKALPFVLSFASGDRLLIEVYGCGEEPSTFWRVMGALQRLTKLAPSWDSYGSQPLNPSAVTRVFKFLDLLLPENAPEPTIIPTRDGGVQFEWHRRGVDLEVKVPPSGPIAQFFSDAQTGEEREWEGTIDRGIVSRAFARMRELT